MTCEICGAATKIIHDPQFNLNYHYCEVCQFIAQDRDQLVTFSEEREEYDRHENSIENEGYVRFFKNFLDEGLLPYVTGGHGLDFGSGPEPVLSQVLKRDYGLTVDIYDLHYQPEKVYENKTYDFIVCTEVIEHVTDPMNYFKRFSDHLKPGGILSVMTLFHPDDEAVFLDWWYRRDITHISFFTEKTLAVIAEQTGLERIHTDGKRVATFRKQA